MNQETTIFDKILSREIPAEIVYEDDLCLAFNDINPQAPIHILIIPKKRIASLAEVKDEDAPLLGHLLLVISKLAKQVGLESGYRTVLNTGTDGGQDVYHLHFHLLGKRSLNWPPG
ncbi:MAG: histidine triad nucleotide-binding protein [Planctomycetaceae bacterium]|nr:histidine triad nucleotide-binding protein [Planctomycetaceae bacterium]